MVKRIVLVLVLAWVFVGQAYAQTQEQLQENGQPCPPECTVDTMEILFFNI